MTFAYDEELLSAVEQAIEPDNIVTTADMACEAAINALDILAALATHDDTAPHVWANKIFVGLIVKRTNTLVGLMLAKSPEVSRAA
jgi:chaperonin GroEL (HSP60 family)